MHTSLKISYNQIIECLTTKSSEKQLKCNEIIHAWDTDLIYIYIIYHVPPMLGMQGICIESLLKYPQSLPIIPALYNYDQCFGMPTYIMP